MRPRIRAIETRYAGCRFRSRIEARWAVLLTRLDIRWEYEPQGFAMGGVSYLPDFYLPDVSKYLEIKGANPSAADTDKVLKLAEAMEGQATVTLLKGDIPQESFTLTVGGIKCEMAQKGSSGWSLVPSLWVAHADRRFLNAALTQARSARFEHGESP